MIKCIDGRKRTVMYFGNTSPLILQECYNEIKARLLSDGFSITHLSYGTKSKPSKNITKAIKTEKRFLELFKANPEEATSWELYCINPEENDLSHKFSLHIMLSTVSNDFGFTLCSMISTDISLLEHIELEAYMKILKKNIIWEKEVVFDCGKNDIPLNYAFNQNPSVFKCINIISEKLNK